MILAIQGSIFLKLSKTTITIVSSLIKQWTVFLYFYKFQFFCFAKNHKILQELLSIKFFGSDDKCRGMANFFCSTFFFSIIQKVTKSTQIIQIK